jgi:hypothetical protein
MEAVHADIQAAIVDLAEKRILANQAAIAHSDARDKDRLATAAAETAQNKLNAIIQRKVNDLVRPSTQ